MRRFPARFRQLLQQAVGLQAFLDAGIRHMQGAGNDPMLAPLLVLPEVDQGDVRLVEKPCRLLGADRPALARDNLLGEPDTHIGGNGDIHHFRIGQVEVVHQRGIFVDRLHLEPRIEGLLLADGRNRVAFIVVRRIDQGVIGKLEQASEQRVILRPRVAVLEVGASRAPDQQRVAAEHPVGHDDSCRNRRYGPAYTALRGSIPRCRPGRRRRP